MSVASFEHVTVKSAARHCHPYMKLFTSALRGLASSGVLRSGRRCCPSAALSSAATYSDSHCHLFHEQFGGPAEQDAAAERAARAGVAAVVNGLCPETNRVVLELCSRHEMLYPAAGIYPLDACGSELAARPELWVHDFEPPVSGGGWRLGVSRR